MSFARRPPLHAGMNAAGARMQGQYRSMRPQGAMAYVIDSGVASYISEAAYRQKNYLPKFDDLPTEDEYDR